MNEDKYMTPTQPAEAGSVKRYIMDGHTGHAEYVLASDFDAVVAERDLLQRGTDAAMRLKEKAEAERDAALARLRELYEPAWNVAHGITDAEGLFRDIRALREALALIGPLPALPPRPGNAGDQ